MTISIKLILVGLVVATGCTRQTEPAQQTPHLEKQESRLSVVATTNIAADLAKQIGGSALKVTALMGPGVDPHLYKASEGDVARLMNADVVVYNGLHLEGKMVDMLAGMNARGKTAIALADAIPEDQLLGFGESKNLHDPHVWMDVMLWRRCAEELAARLSKTDPEHGALYASNLTSYLVQLNDLHAYAVSRAAELADHQRVMVTAHDAFSYFGRSYGFEVRGLLGISTAAEAGTADVVKLADFIVARRIPAIFIESTISDRYLKALQEAVAAQSYTVEIGGQLFSDALGNADGPAGTYVGMIKSNVDTIVNALSKKGD